MSKDEKNVKICKIYQTGKLKKTDIDITDFYDNSNSEKIKT